ncbi:hypothetical protein PN498_18430 [Oscillatoria sp. CS-180]|uniref:hypothetical protein n=1 Tax=Oscillatoria sp. CS-180 TaxID=3021720 RepID=UPI00232F5E06|nr:hypothetical protein [Oscillatoria sp. CS-180]MDB9527977.1 hypothetical protein [Oscillatoria sp. CS-180]
MSSDDLSKAQVQQSDANRSTVPKLAQNFLAGAFLSGLPIFVYLVLSLEMTHTSVAEVGWVTLGSAIALPVFVGCLAALLPKTIIKALSEMLESINLPF